MKDPSQRSILVPLGDIKAIKRGCHVQVTVVPSAESTAPYIRFSVNTTLGRIDCAAEPALVYKKVHIHALTHSPVADPLTGRTGAEEALSVLSSGICQPWAPLAQNGYAAMTLHSIASLSPKREYYPPDVSTENKLIPFLSRSVMEPSTRQDEQLDTNLFLPKR